MQSPDRSAAGMNMIYCSKITSFPLTDSVDRVDYRNFIKVLVGSERIEYPMPEDLICTGRLSLPQLYVTSEPEAYRSRCGFQTLP